MGPQTLERSTVIRVLPAFLFPTVFSLCSFHHGTLVADQIPPSILVVIGAEGTAEYGEQFREWAHKWEAFADSFGNKLQTIGAKPGAVEDREQLRIALQGHDAIATSPLILVLIGHGTGATTSPNSTSSGRISRRRS